MGEGRKEKQRREDGRGRGKQRTGKEIFTAFILPTQTRDLNTYIRAEMDGAIIRPEGKRKEKEREMRRGGGDSNVCGGNKVTEFLVTQTRDPNAFTKGQMEGGRLRTKGKSNKKGEEGKNNVYADKRKLQIFYITHPRATLKAFIKG
jgi:hypothetical protein